MALPDQELSVSLADGEVDDVWVGNKYKRGFDRNLPDTMGDVAYDESTRTFTHAPKSGQDEFYFFVMGNKIHKTATDSIVWPDVTGTYYFYYDTDGVLQYTINSDFVEAIFIPACICGLVYWNATTQKALIQAGDEKHGVSAEAYWHLNHHLGVGAQWNFGLNPLGFVDGSDTYSGFSLGVSSDEDIFHTTPASTTNPFVWREGADGEWVESAPDNKIAHMGSSYAYWNEWTGSIWQLTESASSTDYIIYFSAWTNDTNNPVKKLVGQKTYSSRNAAREGLQLELTAIKMQGLPGTEIYSVIAYIAKRNGDLEDDGNGNAYVDLRLEIGF